MQQPQPQPQHLCAQQPACYHSVSQSVRSRCNRRLIGVGLLVVLLLVLVLVLAE